MFRIKSSSVSFIKVLCESAALFYVRDLQKNGIMAGGHCFVKTNFALREKQGTFPLYFCRCGEMALEHDDEGHTICGLTAKGCERELSHCRLDPSLNVRKT